MDQRKKIKYKKIQDLDTGLLVLGFLLSLLLQGGCSKHDAQKEIVAEWKDKVITRSDFERSYYLYWQSNQMNDSPEARKQFARVMIEQELIADHGRKLHLDTLNQIRSMVQRDLEKFARKRYLEIFIKDTIPSPTEEEISLALHRSETTMFVRQIYGDTAEEIQTYYNLLTAQIPAGKINSILHPDAGRFLSVDTLGWISWGETDPPVEQVLYSLKQGEMSKPVQSLLGWHIFMVDSVRRKIQFGLTSPLEKENIRMRLLDRKFDIAVAVFTRTALWSKELVVDASLFLPIWTILAPLFNQPASALVPSSHSADVDLVPPELAARVLARIDGDPLSVGEFLNHLPDLPRDVLHPNLKRAVEIVLRDRFLTRLALTAGMDQDPAVKEKIKRQATSYLYYKTIQMESSRFQFSTSEMQKYFEENRKHYPKKVETEIYEILMARADSARAIARRIQNGEDFSAMAAKYSLRRDSGQKGGYRGYIKQQEEPLGRIAATLKEGDLYAPVKNDFGYSIIRIGKKRMEYYEFSEVQSQVLKDMQKDRLDILSRKLLPPEYKETEVILHPDILARIFTDRKTVF